MATPLIFNRYRLIETKGKGGFGTVDLAWDSRLQRKVAIKRIPLSSSGESNYGSGSAGIAGIQEARTAALLSDARIVNVLDFDVTSSEALLIMEYVDGSTLNTLLSESGELLDLDTIAAIANDVAGAIESAHENQVLHLDIKPDNVLIDHKGNIKVSDFGLAMLSSTAGFAEPQGGTIGFMPPEQIEQGEVDARSDLWAYAAMLYLLITGSNPYFAPSTQESYAQICDGELPLPTTLREGLDLRLDGIFVRALHPQKEQRYSNITELLKALRPALGSIQKGRKQLKFMVNDRELDEIEYSDVWHDEDASETDDISYILDTFEDADLEYVDFGDQFEAEDVQYDRTAAAVASQDATDSDGFWPTIPRVARGLIVRLIAAIACCMFALPALLGFSVAGFFGLASPVEVNADLTASLAVLIDPTSAHFIILASLIGLIALAALAMPQLGSALSIVVVCVGIFVGGDILVGIVVLIVLSLWWSLIGRKSAAASILVMLVPLAGQLGLIYALPLMAGLFLPWHKAFITAALQAFLLIMFALTTSAATFGVSLIDVQINGVLLLGKTFDAQPGLASIANPAPWITLLSFVLAALVLAKLLESKSSRLRTIGSVSLAAAIVAIICIIVPYVTDLSAFNEFALLPDLGKTNIWMNNLSNVALDLGLSFILLVVLTLFGASSSYAIVADEDLSPPR